MSLQALAWAIEYQDLPRDERSGRIQSSCKLVLQALANHAGPGGGDCFPSIETIIYYTGLSERAVQYALRAMEEHGTIAETPDPLVRASTITRPDKRPKSYDLVAFQRGARSTNGVQDRIARGAKSKINSPDTGCKVSGDLAPDPVIEPVTPNCNLELSEADASDNDARASCPGQTDATADDVGGEADGGINDQFTSWPGLDQETRREGQDPRTPRLENGSSANGGSRGSGMKVKRTRRSSSRAELPPEQAAAVAERVAAWVDAYRDAHAGVEPTQNKRGQAAREIRALIVAGNSPDRVLHAARSAGRAGFATVEQQLARMTSTNGGSRPGRVSATELPRDDWRRFVQE